MNVKRWSYAMGMGLAMMALAAFAGEPPSQNEEQTVTVEATVMAINHETRMVTLETADGSTMEIKAGPEVKRLNEIETGDGVVLTYHESLVMSIVPAAEAGQTGAAVTAAVGRAPDTESPAGSVVRRIDAVVEITAIDKTAQTVHVKGPQGNVVTVRVRHPENLGKLKVGDRVHIAYTEAVAVAIVPKGQN